MVSTVFSGSVWQLLKSIDLLSQLVLGALFTLSVLCGAIVLYKFFSLRRWSRAMSGIVQALKSAHSFDELLAVGKQFEGTLPAQFLLDNLAVLKRLVDQYGKKLTPQALESFQLTLDQSAEQLMSVQESYLPILTTSATVSPLMGLFGTVWGLIYAFMNIGMQKSADIAVVAPGVAAALTTTLAGLVVAIPALVFSHYFVHKVRHFEQKLDTVADYFFSVVKRTFS